MRRLLVFAFAAVVFGCGGDSTLPPVQTVDGEWHGTQNGYALSINMVQSGTDVTGGTVIGSNGGTSGQGTLVGTFKYPTLHITLTYPGFLPLDYDGTMSQSEAKIVGQLNGSGVDHKQIDVTKQ